MKNYIETQDKIKYLVFEADVSDKIDTIAVGMIENNIIDGIIPFSISQFDDKITIRYDVTQFITMSELIDEYMSREKILSVIDSILSVYSGVEDYFIEFESLQLDCDKIFYRKKDDSVHMICLPVMNKNIGNPQLNVFLKSFICRLKFDSTENCDYIGKMLGYLNSSTDFLVSDFVYIVDSQKKPGLPVINVSEEKITEKLSGVIPDEVHDEKIKEKVQQAKEEDKNIKPEYILTKPQIDKKNIDPDTSESTDDPEIGFKLPLDFYADDEDSEEEVKNKEGIFSKLFKEPKSKVKQKKKEEQETPEKIKVHYCDENGEVYNEEELKNQKTPAKQKNEKEKTEKKTFLLRMKNNEKIMLEKNKFKIGTDKKTVDYCINDNHAVSRTHAEIHKKNGSYYLVDNESTNHTYLNEHEIQSNSEIKLQNKSRIKFANEEFVFYISV